MLSFMDRSTKPLGCRAVFKTCVSEMSRVCFDQIGTSCAGACMQELKYVEIVSADVQASTVDVVYQAAEPQIFQHGPQSQ